MFFLKHVLEYTEGPVRQNFFKYGTKRQHNSNRDSYCFTIHVYDVYDTRCRQYNVFNFSWERQSYRLLTYLVQIHGVVRHVVQNNLIVLAVGRLDHHA